MIVDQTMLSYMHMVEKARLDKEWGAVQEKILSLQHLTMARDYLSPELLERTKIALAALNKAERELEDKFRQLEIDKHVNILQQIEIELELK